MNNIFRMLTVVGITFTCGSVVLNAQPAYSFQQIDHPDASPATGKYSGGINASGQIVGYYTDSTGKLRGFKWSAGTFTAVDCPAAYGAGTQAEGINNTGQIVGT